MNDIQLIQEIVQEIIDELKLPLWAERHGKQIKLYQLADKLQGVRIGRRQPPLIIYTIEKTLITEGEVVVNLSDPYSLDMLKADIEFGYFCTKPRSSKALALVELPWQVTKYFYRNREVIKEWVKDTHKTWPHHIKEFALHIYRASGIVKPMTKMKLGVIAEILEQHSDRHR